MKANNITLRQLRAFVAVSEHSSFVAASNAIGLSQPALSQSVRQLEAELGARLFIRTTRSVQLTGIGISFLTHARHVLRLMDDVTREMEETIKRRSGSMVVACLPSVTWRMMPSVLAESAKLFPDMRIVVHDMNMSRIRKAVLSGEADVGIGSLAGPPGEFSSTAITRDRMHVLFPSGHPFEKLDAVEWRQLDGVSYVGMTEESGIRDIVDEVSSSIDLELTYAAEVSGHATLIGLVERGAGITAMPGLALPRSDTPSLMSRPLIAPETNRKASIIWRRSSVASPEAARLLKAFDAVRRSGTIDGEGKAFEWCDFEVPTIV